MIPTSTIQLVPPYAPPTLPTEPYAVWILAADTLSAEQMMEIARALVASGCRYAVCSGQDSSAWDDAVDIAYVSCDPRRDDDAQFVMTSWHRDESLEEVAHHLVRNTAFDYFVPQRFVILGIGTLAPVEEARRLVQIDAGESAT